MSSIKNPLALNNPRVHRRILYVEHHALAPLAQPAYDHWPMNRARNMESADRRAIRNFDHANASLGCAATSQQASSISPKTRHGCSRGRDTGSSSSRVWISRARTPQQITRALSFNRRCVHGVTVPRAVTQIAICSTHAIRLPAVYQG